MNQMRTIRLQKEMKTLQTEKFDGIEIKIGEKIDKFEAIIIGPEKTPYENGEFKIEIVIPENYPLQPPNIRFLTPIYHPNIDDQGRICLDTLKMAGKNREGGWNCALSIGTLIQMVRLLLETPNPDDGLMLESSKEFVQNRDLFNQKARNFTISHAINNKSNLNKSNLNQSNLNKSNLNQPNLNESNKNETNLNKSNLNQSNLNQSNLNQSNLNETNLNKTNLNKSNLNQSNLNKSNLNQSNLNQSNLNQSNLNKSNLNQSNLNQSNLNQSNLNESKLNQSKI
ncbi:ubiquitin-conjugating enzyme e2 t [Anaeramoeba ignava]|uniref:Ubiquitin-conjugating enzyme e2 t n=1 Tax=Anaeramoeba ignava TaxID=1746090 RepID=A0A9Q0LDQ6_ANAIG|nr:ubiquitin-conjugating enzyme e2 t [Anaeramoeba ignava]